MKFWKHILFIMCSLGILLFELQLFDFLQDLILLDVSGLQTFDSLPLSNYFSTSQSFQF